MSQGDEDIKSRGLQEVRVNKKLTGVASLKYTLVAVSVDTVVSDES